MSAKVRVRFAPSPTGFLHIGGARAALFNYLFARSQGGEFLLRIEDTDLERSEERFTQDIQESLTWLGLKWDEPPIRQSERREFHDSVVKKLIEEGHAYYCYWSSEELAELRETCRREKRNFQYPGNKPAPTGDGPYPVRIRTSKEGHTSFNDAIRGEISFPNVELDDWVIQRADGSPTYNFVCVLDDHFQRITHVLRGEDHINNTPKQIQLYRLMGYAEPTFAHLPMVLGPDRAKLSKRHGAASTLEYRKMGFLPAAMVNFLVRLGWSHGDQEVFSLEELEKIFGLESIGKANAIYSSDKLDWYSGHFIREADSKWLGEYLRTYFKEESQKFSDVSAEDWTYGVSVVQPKVKNLLEMFPQLDCLFGEDPDYDFSKLKAKDLDPMTGVWSDLLGPLEGCDFTLEGIEACIKGYVEEKGVKFGVVGKSVRYAVTGGRVSPDLYPMLKAQGKERVLRRFRNVLEAKGA